LAEGGTKSGAVLAVLVAGTDAWVPPVPGPFVALVDVATVFVGNGFGG
jgi:hypothetical protein